MELVNGISTGLGIFVFIAFFYQIIYFLVGMGAEARTRLITSKRPPLPEPESAKTNRYAFVIAARNEAGVIAQLIESIHLQDYPSELIDILVIADNCSDRTAAIANEAGAIVYERNDKSKLGKGYALTELFKSVKKDYGYDNWDGYIIFDADNIIDKNFLSEMDKEFCAGNRIITGYRNSKNFGDNWITAGYSVAFMREAQYLNRPRKILHSSATVSGTGYLFSHEILEENDGWIYHLLTEDLEFTADTIVKGEKIAYAPGAMFYDEQPTGFKQSWMQRLRWTRGFYQVIFHYGKGLLGNLFKDRSMVLSRYDLFMFLAPSLLFNIATVSLSVLALILNIIDMQKAAAMGPDVALSIVSGIAGYYALNFAQAFVTVISEWKKIKATNGKKIASMFTYPIFMFTYIPLSLCALFVRPQWTPIAHKDAKSIEDINKANVYRPEYSDVIYTSDEEDISS